MEKQRPNNNGGGPKMNMPKFNMNWIYFVAILTLAMLYMTSSGDGIGASQAHTEASYTDFKAFVERGYADKIVRLFLSSFAGDFGCIKFCLIRNRCVLTFRKRMN